MVISEESGRSAICNSPDIARQLYLRPTASGGNLGANPPIKKMAGPMVTANQKELDFIFFPYLSLFYKSFAPQDQPLDEENRRPNVVKIWRSHAQVSPHPFSELSAKAGRRRDLLVAAEAQET